MGDADLDYEIVDKAGECPPPRTSAAATSPGLSGTSRAGRGSKDRDLGGR